MNLAVARPMAEKILALLLPYCDLGAVAGSIRRGRSWVNDIDLVLLPKPGLEASLRERCQQKAHVVVNGPQQMILKLVHGVQLDLWFAHPERKDLLETEPTNFGSVLLCRTGSKEHNIYLVERAKGMGLTWNPHHGVFREGKRIAGATEADIFEALDLPFVAPERRER